MSYVPLRRCVACGRVGEKPTYLRVGRLGDGSFAVDEKPPAGRGAYVCRDFACVERARKRRCLERAFGVQVPASVYEELRDSVE